MIVRNAVVMESVPRAVATGSRLRPYRDRCRTYPIATALGTDSMRRRRPVLKTTLLERSAGEKYSRGPGVRCRRDVR